MALPHMELWRHTLYWTAPCILTSPPKLSKLEDYLFTQIGPFYSDWIAPSCTGYPQNFDAGGDGFHQIGMCGVTTINGKFLIGGPRCAP